LTAIDVFSKFAWIVALKTKTDEDTAEGLKQILGSVPADKKASIVQSDNGGEFKGEVTTLLEERGIKQIFSSPYNPRSQGHIELYNKKFKSLLKRYFEQEKTKDWVDAIPSLLKNYNATEHSVTKRKPAELITETSEEKKTDAEKKITSTAQRRISSRAYKDDIKVGDKVRVSILPDKKNHFEEDQHEQNLH